MAAPVTVAQASYNVKNTDSIILADTSTNAVTINLMPYHLVGTNYELLVIHAVGNNEVIIDPYSTEQVNRSSQYSFNKNHKSVHLKPISNGQWEAWSNLSDIIETTAIRLHSNMDNTAERSYIGIIKLLTVEFFSELSGYSFEVAVDGQVYTPKTTVADINAWITQFVISNTKFRIKYIGSYTSGKSGNTDLIVKYQYL